jgi:hypothetical protein
MNSPVESSYLLAPTDETFSGQLMRLFSGRNAEPAHAGAPSIH